MNHRAMDPVIAKINELYKTARYYRWADKMVLLGQAFWHIISMDGLEIAATALSNTMVCPTCECPKEELDRTDKLYPTRSTKDVRVGVEKARVELMSRDGSIKDRCVLLLNLPFLFRDLVVPEVMFPSAICHFWSKFL